MGSLSIKICVGFFIVALSLACSSQGEIINPLTNLSDSTPSSRNAATPSNSLKDEAPLPPCSTEPSEEKFWEGASQGLPPFGTDPKSKADATERLEAIRRRNNWANRNPSVKARVVSVVSPDTVEVNFLQDKGRTIYTLRYRDIEGPGASDKSQHYFFQAALKENQRLVGGSTIDLQTCVLARGEKNVIWADVVADQVKVNSSLVAGGYAWARYSLTSNSSPLGNLEAAAKADKRGLWRVWWANHPSEGLFPIDDPRKAYMNNLRQMEIPVNPFNQAGMRLIQNAADSAYAQFLGGMVTGEIVNHPDNAASGTSDTKTLTDRYGEFLAGFRTGTVEPWSLSTAEAGEKKMIELRTRNLDKLKAFPWFEVCNWIGLNVGERYEAIQSANRVGELSQLEVIIMSFVLDFNGWDNWRRAAYLPGAGPALADGLGRVDETTREQRESVLKAYFSCR